MEFLSTQFSAGSSSRYFVEMDVLCAPPQHTLLALFKNAQIYKWCSRRFGHTMDAFFGPCLGLYLANCARKSRHRIKLDDPSTMLMNRC